MSATIKFFHPDETFLYYLDKSFCKVVYLKKKNCLVLEIESTEELDHLDEDSLQNEYPKVILNIDDFPINVSHKDELANNSYEIIDGTVEEEDEEGDLIDVFYTNLKVNEDEYELNENKISFSTTKEGKLQVLWTGEVEDFTESTDDVITFEVNCILEEKEIVVLED